MAAQHEALSTSWRLTGPPALRGTCPPGSPPYCADRPTSMLGSFAMAQAKSRGARAAKKPACSQECNRRGKRVAGQAPAPPNHPAQAGREHIRSYFEAIARRDATRWPTHWSEDGVADIVPLGILRGRAEIIGVLPRSVRRGARPADQGHPRRAPASTRRPSNGAWTGHFTGEPFQGVEPTGRWVELRGVDLIEIADGKNVSTAAYYDGMAFARQIGLMPPQDSERRARDEERLQRRHQACAGRSPTGGPAGDRPRRAHCRPDLVDHRLGVRHQGLRRLPAHRC